jgi:hypothetical protein
MQTKDKFNWTAVELHKLCLDKLCRVIVPGDTDCSFIVFFPIACIPFKDNSKTFRPDGLCLPAVAYKMVVLDIVLVISLINAVCSVASFRSVRAALPLPRRKARDLGNG